MKKHNFLIDILLTLITFGIWNLYVQMRQIHDYNDITGEDMSVVLVFVLSILTFGLYFVYHEFRLTRELRKLLGKPNFLVELFTGVLAFIGLWFIVDSYQQVLLNEILEKQN